MVKKAKPKKPRPMVLRDPSPSWNLGRWARFTQTSDQPIAEFLKDQNHPHHQDGETPTESSQN